MGRLGRFFRYKVFVDALFHSEVMSIFNLPIDNRYFTLSLLYTPTDAPGVHCSHKYALASRQVPANQKSIQL